MARNDRLEQDTDEGFLRRWARRKSGLHEGAERSVPEATASPEDAAAEAGSEPDGQPAKTDADMPPLESIGPGFDVSEFFSPGVSEALRNQALRRLFQSPAYNVTDGLDDYAGNYNNFEALGDVMTADRRYREEFQKARAAEKRSANESESTEAAVDEVVDDQDPDAPDPGEGDGEESEAGRRDVAARRSDEDEKERTNTTLGPGNRGTEA